MDRQFWRLPRVIDEVGLARRSIYDLMARKEFPRPVKITTKTIGWCSDEVNAWKETRIAERDRAQGAGSQPCEVA